MTPMMISMCMVYVCGCRTMQSEDYLSLTESAEEVCQDHFFDHHLQKCLDVTQNHHISGDIVIGCMETFSQDKGRLICLNLMGQSKLSLGHIDICEDLYGHEIEEYRCLLRVARQGLDAETMDSCRASFDQTSDVERCFDLMDSQGVNHSQIDSCGQSFVMVNDIFTCIDEAVRDHLLDSQIISCRNTHPQSYDKRMSCIKSIHVESS